MQHSHRHHGHHHPHPLHHAHREGHRHEGRHAHEGHHSHDGHYSHDGHHSRDGHHSHEGWNHHHGHHPHEFGPRGQGGRGPFGHDWDDERGEGRGRRQRLFDASGLRLILLKLIADQPRHGYDLIRAIDELTAGHYAPSAGVVYPALSILQDLDHIEAAASEGARKAFAVTAAGLEELAANADKVAELFARLSALATPRDDGGRIPLRRAMENLGAVLRNRLAGGNGDKETLHAAIAIIDEAAQRIERL